MQQAIFTRQNERASSASAALTEENAAVAVPAAAAKNKEVSYELPFDCRYYPCGFGGGHEPVFRQEQGKEGSQRKLQKLSGISVLWRWTPPLRPPG